MKNLEALENQKAPSPETVPAFRYEPRASDREHIRELVAATGHFSPAEFDIAVELVEERLAKGPASGYEFVFLDDGDALIAYACYGEIPCTVGSYDLYWIAVDPARQGQGLGRLVMREVERLVHERGGRRLYADTSGSAQYAATRSFYERFGFTEEARLRDFYAVGDDKVVFGKAV
jgi:D-alanine-D-alanine ligase